MAKFGWRDWLSGTKQADGGFSFGFSPASPGPQASAASQSVTPASDSPAFPVSAASLPLPTGAATEASAAQAALFARQKVVSCVVSANGTYDINDSIDTSKTIAVGIGNNTPFVISDIQFSIVGTVSMPSTTPLQTSVLEDVPTGTYTDGAVIAPTNADQDATVSGGGVNLQVGAGGLFAVGRTAAYKGLGGGRTSSSGDIYVTNFTSAAITFGGAARLVIRLTINY